MKRSIFSAVLFIPIVLMGCSQNLNMQQGAVDSSGQIDSSNQFPRGIAPTQANWAPTEQSALDLSQGYSKMLQYSSQIMTHITNGPIPGWKTFATDGYSIQYPNSWHLDATPYYDAVGHNLEVEDKYTRLIITLTSPPNYNVPGFSKSPVYYGLFINYLGQRDYKVANNAFGDFQYHGDADALEVQVTNDFLRNSQEYKTAQKSISTVSPKMNFPSVPADQNGQTSLVYPPGNGFASTIFYPSNWVSACEPYGGSCAISNEIDESLVSDNYHGVQPNLCEINAGFSRTPNVWGNIEGSIFTNTTNTFTDPTAKANCQKQLDAIQSQIH